jgi:Flp pilus assembly secretin CpaC
MRRTPLFIAKHAAILAALGLLSAAAAAQAASRVTVGINQGLRLQVGGSAANVVVANPAIADVTVVDAHSVIILGKGYGTTQIMVLDSTGRLLMDSIVTVNAPAEGQMTVYRGPLAQQYDCSPRCEADGAKAGAPAAAAPSP